MRTTMIFPFYQEIQSIINLRLPAYYGARYWLIAPVDCISTWDLRAKVWRDHQAVLRARGESITGIAGRIV